MRCSAGPGCRHVESLTRESEAGPSTPAILAIGDQTGCEFSLTITFTSRLMGPVLSATE
jgi:hypothetical protein